MWKCIDLYKLWGWCPARYGSYNGKGAVPTSSLCRKFMLKNDLEALFEIISVTNVDTMLADTNVLNFGMEPC